MSKGLSWQQHDLLVCLLRKASQKSWASSPPLTERAIPVRELSDTYCCCDIDGNINAQRQIANRNTNRALRSLERRKFVQHRGKLKDLIDDGYIVRCHHWSITEAGIAHAHARAG